MPQITSRLHPQPYLAQFLQLGHDDVWRFWATPFRGSLTVSRKPFGEGGLHLQEPKLNPDDVYNVST